MENEGPHNGQGATQSGPRPGNFPLGSEKSRAAARVALEAREADSEQPVQLIAILMRAGDEWDDASIRKLHESLRLHKGKLPVSPGSEAGALGDWVECG
jgi:hypothetical protein